jgi:hypothetical protein
MINALKKHGAYRIVHYYHEGQIPSAKRYGEAALIWPIDSDTNKPIGYPSLSNGEEWLSLGPDGSLEKDFFKALEELAETTDTDVDKKIAEKNHVLKESLELQISNIYAVSLDEAKGHAEDKVNELRLDHSPLIESATNVADNAMDQSGIALAKANEALEIKSDAIGHTVAIFDTDVVSHIPHGGEGKKPKWLKIDGHVEDWWFFPRLSGLAVFNSDDTVTITGTKYFYDEDFDHEDPLNHFSHTDKIFAFGAAWGAGLMEATISVDGDKFILTMSVNQSFEEPLIISLRLTWGF